MASNYTLVASHSSVQVLSPTATLNTVVATIETKPHGVIFDYWVAKDAWDAGTAPDILTAVAAGVEHVMSTEPVSDAVGTNQLSGSSLYAGTITFTVAYKVPGSAFPPATVDVDVPVTDFGQDTLDGVNAGLDNAHALIQQAYTQLKAAAAG